MRDRDIHSTTLTMEGQGPNAHHGAQGRGNGLGMSESQEQLNDLMRQKETQTYVFLDCVGAVWVGGCA